MVNITEKLAEGIKDRGVALSYGPAVTVDGRELVPVALVGYGFGGGSAPAEDGSDENASGGGGGGTSIPVGAYVAGPNGAVFQPNVIALLAVSIPVIWVAGKAIARIIKAF